MLVAAEAELDLPGAYEHDVARAYGDAAQLLGRRKVLGVTACPPGSRSTPWTRATSSRTPRETRWRGLSIPLNSAPPWAVMVAAGRPL